MKFPAALTGWVLGASLATSLHAVEFEPWCYTDSSLFPSAIISTATVEWSVETNEDDDDAEEGESESENMETLGNPNSWLAVLLSDVPRNAKVKVEVSVDGFLKDASWEGVIKDGADQIQIFPSESWDFEALYKVREQRPVNASFKVTVNGKALPTQYKVFTVRSLNDCPFYIETDEETGEFDDFSFVFAAYVNENHPWIDNILRDALKTGIVDSFTGYQSEDQDEVVRQVFAIWTTLQRRGISYSDISTTTPAGSVWCQTVRFPDESIDALQANCVDGSVLLASILRKIGLNVYLTFVPGHCLLAFDLGEGEEDAVWGLETTLIGEEDITATRAKLGLPADIKVKKYAASYKTFAAAIADGNSTLKKNAKAFEKADDPDKQMISIADARELGIMPIASGRARVK